MHRFLLLFAACAPTIHPQAAWRHGESWSGQCATGKQQSPVAVAGRPGFAPQVQLEYWPSHTRVTNDGHTLRLDYDPGSFLTADGKRFALQTLQLHHPGEHTVDGKSFPLELQLLHKSDGGKRAIVAVPVVEGAENAWMRPLLANLPRPGESREPTARVNAADLVPRSRVFLSYPG